MKIPCRNAPVFAMAGLVMVAFAGCAGGPEAASASQARAAQTSAAQTSAAKTPASQAPTPLAGAAQEYMRLVIAEHARGPLEAGTTATMKGEVAYDGWISVGSTFAPDRGASFDAFLRNLRSRGGAYEVLEETQSGAPTRVLVVCEGKRLVVGRLQW